MTIKKVFNITVLVFVVIISSILIATTVSDVDMNNKELTQKIDSLENVNDNLTKEINDIEKDKDEKIIEVKKLNNDSTLILFYKLVKD